MTLFFLIINKNNGFYSELKADSEMCKRHYCRLVRAKLGIHTSQHFQIHPKIENLQNTDRVFLCFDTDGYDTKAL